MEVFIIFETSKGVIPLRDFDELLKRKRPFFKKNTHQNIETI